MAILLNQNIKLLKFSILNNNIAPVIPATLYRLRQVAQVLFKYIDLSNYSGTAVLSIGRQFQ